MFIDGSGDGIGQGIYVRAPFGALILRGVQFGNWEVTLNEISTMNMKSGGNQT